tara:strand:+ start:139 stop:2136 length:1998 start_codon:yes stop_codon:yes gene_type:complete
MSGETITIEIAQKDAGTVFSNGDFVNQLAMPVVLSEGDQLVINKTFIDTLEENSGRLDIESDITVKLTVVPYVTADVADKFSPISGLVEQVPVNNLDYFPMRIQSQAEADKLKNVKIIKQVYFFYDYFDNYGHFGSTNKPVILYYYDRHENFTEISLQLPKTDPGEQPLIIMDVSIIVTDMQEKYPTNPKYFTKYYNRGLGVKTGATVETLWDANGCNPVAMTTKQYSEAGENKGYEHGGFYVFDITDLPADTTTSTSLESFEFSVDIDQGNYTPTEITTLLNNAFVKNNTTELFSYGNFIDSPFLKYSSAELTEVQAGALVFNGAADYIAGSGANTTHNHILVSNEGSDVINVPNTGAIGLNPSSITTLKNDFVVGSDSVEIEYDDESNKFYWKQLHMSVYDTEDGTASTQVNRYREADGTVVNFIRKKSGGVCFSAMYACLRSDPNKNYDFWEDKLGFNTANMLIPTEQYKQIPVASTTFRAEVPKIINGVHTTTATHTINGLTSKKKKSYMKIPAEPAFDPATEDTAFPYVESNNNEVIFADTVTVSTVEDPRTSSGYFFIEIIAGFNNLIVSDAITTQNIHAIINRYYNRGAYTSSTETDSMVYTHHGAPLILSSIRTRVLLPNRTVPKTLGNDNTIFMEVIKAPPPTPQQIEQEKQQQKK